MIHSERLMKLGGVGNRVHYTKQVILTLHIQKQDKTIHTSSQISCYPYGTIKFPRNACETFSGLPSMLDNVCEAEFQKKRFENSLAAVAYFFAGRMVSCRSSGSPILTSRSIFCQLAMIRTSREGRDWDLYLSSISNLHRDPLPAITNITRGTSRRICR